jgi:hypothetical protein
MREKDKVAADGKVPPAVGCFCLLLTSPLPGRKGINVEPVDSHHFTYYLSRKEKKNPAQIKIPRNPGPPTRM